MNGQDSIIIVEDEKRLRDLLQTFLTKSGFIVYSSEDSIEMDKHMKEHSFDLMICDLMLPGEDGISITRRVHDSTNIPIIILSARSEDSNRIEGLNAGADDYITKPFNPKELLARIHAVLRRHKTQKT